jgi:hypothetical protein
MSCCDFRDSSVYVLVEPIANPALRGTTLVVLRRFELAIPPRGLACIFQPSACVALGQEPVLMALVATSQAVLALLVAGEVTTRFSRNLRAYFLSTQMYFSPRF